MAIGCTPYTARNVDLLPRLAQGDYDAALQTLEDHRRPNDELLYWLQRGLVLHQAGRWDESNTAFETAERWAEDLYTQSISQNVAAFIVNDTTVAYRAEPFEMAMVPYYRSLNYAYLGQSDEAVVEARKASEYLERYVDDAFLQYYTGLLYEWAGETNDAFIAYRNAAQAYALTGDLLGVQAPASLGRELLRTGVRLGFSDELAELAEQYPAMLPPRDESGAAEAPTADGAEPHGEVVVLLEVGSVAQKVQTEINFPILSSDDYDDYEVWAADLSDRVSAGWHPPDDVEIDYWLRVALPRLVSSRSDIAALRVSAGANAPAAWAVVANDLESRAFATFDAERPKILTTAIVRALVKYSASKRAERESEGLGYLVNLLGAVVEQADTRCWTTLPNRIALARMQLHPGSYDLRVELLSAEGRVVGTENLPTVSVRANDWTFAAFRVY